MQRQQLADLFKVYDPKTQQVLEEVLFLEQQYITVDLKTRRNALKDLRAKIDEVIKKAVAT